MYYRTDPVDIERETRGIGSIVQLVVLAWHEALGYSFPT